MPTNIEYALLAGSVYGNSREVRSEQNTQQTKSTFLTADWVAMPAPAGWPVNPTTGLVDAASGFMATAYRNSAGEIVISYAGTTPGALDWVWGNIPAGVGVTAPQVLEAALFYMSVVQQNPGATITFTGHSLGGGLASLMALFFNRPAVVFDEAPFALSADSTIVYASVIDTLAAAGYAIPSALASYVPGASRSARESNVHQIFTVGEILSLFGGTAKIAGSVTPFNPHAVNNLGWDGTALGANGNPLDLHSMPLLTGFMLSSGFLDAATTHPELLARMFKGFYPNDPVSRTATLLDLLVQREVAGERSLDVLASSVNLIRSDGLEADTFNFNQGNVQLNMTVAGALVDVVLAGLYQQGQNRTPSQGFCRCSTKS